MMTEYSVAEQLVDSHTVPCLLEVPLCVYISED